MALDDRVLVPLVIVVVVRTGVGGRTTGNETPSLLVDVDTRLAADRGSLVGREQVLLLTFDLILDVTGVVMVLAITRVGIVEIERGSLSFMDIVPKACDLMVMHEWTRGMDSVTVLQSRVCSD